MIERGQSPDAEIPPVFRRMPADLLTSYARHGVLGAAKELRRRRAEEAQAQGECKLTEIRKARTTEP